MGMFDSFYDATGREWQTKAFDCNLDIWNIGDWVDADGPLTCQTADREQATNHPGDVLGDAAEVASEGERDE